MVRELPARVSPRHALVALALLVSACDGRFADPRRPDGQPTPPSTPPRSVAPGDARLRLLSGAEYRSTVKDLLGLEASPAIAHGDHGAGFDTGAGGQLSDHLFSALLTEAERLSGRYVESRLAQDFPCFTPADVTDACVREVIAGLGRRAWRRPLSDAQRDALFASFEATATLAESRVAGVEGVIARLLLSPDFLYRAELGRPDAAGSDRRTLDDFEKASLLSYTLTGSMPDEALLADAEAGRLDEGTIRAHVRRLWTTPAARARLADVVRAWVQASSLEDFVARPGDAPKLESPEQGRALKDGFDAYVASVLVDGAGTLPALLQEPFALVNRHSAPLYGLSVEGDGLVRVALDGTERAGLLTQAGVMAALASPGDPSKDRPVLRGFMLKTQLLCESVGPPSGLNTSVAANVAASIPDFDGLTTREQYEAIMQQGEQCASCHAQFMPLGFAFGRYDALGRFRTTQRGRPVNVAVSVPFGGATHAFADALELNRALADAPATADCFTEKLLGYATGVARTPHVDELALALREARGDGPLHVGRLVEELFASPHLYVRIAREDPPAPPTPPTPTEPVDAGLPALPAVVLLRVNAGLDPDQARASLDQAFRLHYQLDGNLVLYRSSGGAVWASGTTGHQPGRAVMQGDGNLVIYDRAGAPRWDTRTNGNPGAQLFIDTAGGLSVRAPDGRVLWTSEVRP
ncbi:MAG: DUF1592 domain-containing protein [Myxococcota bacterium]